MDTPPQAQHKLRWLLPIALGVVLVAGLAVLSQGEPPAPPVRPVAVAPAPLAATSSSAQPKISWSQPSLNLALSLGERTVRSLTLTSSKALQNVALDVVPEIAPFLTVEPTDFATLPAGQPMTLLLSFSAPVTPAVLGMHEGTVHLRQGNRTIPQTLKVSLTIFDDAVPPPDPGAAGTATLAGIDSDQDGVRDDIQRYILQTYPDSRATRAALRQVARALQASLLNSDDQTASIANTVQFFHAKDCLRGIRPLEATAIKDELKARFLDTPARSLAWIAGEVKFSGEIYPITPAAERLGLCEFSVEEIES